MEDVSQCSRLPHASQYHDVPFLVAAAFAAGGGLLYLAAHVLTAGSVEAREALQSIEAEFHEREHLAVFEEAMDRLLDDVRLDVVSKGYNLANEATLSKVMRIYSEALPEEDEEAQLEGEVRTAFSALESRGEGAEGGREREGGRVEGGNGREGGREREGELEAAWIVSPALSRHHRPASARCAPLCSRRCGCAPRRVSGSPQGSPA